uniref:glucuronosyltransferase n=1 Tax=Ascaris lumbricoides TaxID=6252 RepID=A0A9J2PIP0_ASCLU
MRTILVAFALINIASGYKILVYSAQTARSHVTFMGHIADTLADAGHDVVVFLPAFNEDVNITGVKKCRTILKARDFDMPYKTDAVLADFWQKNAASMKEILSVARMFQQSMSLLCESHLRDKDTIKKLSDEKFDLGIGELFNSCSYALFKASNISSHVSVSPTNLVEWMLDPFGVDNNPSYVPALISEHSDRMSYLERAKNLALMAAARYGSEYLSKPVLNPVFRKEFGEQFQLEEEIARSSFLFVNSEDFTEFPRPLNHKIIFIGGIGVQKAKPLKGELKNVMDAAIDGAVLVSFGSLANTSRMPIELKNAFIETFKAFPKLTFIWKYEVDDDIGSGVKNLVKVKWMPQNDLLAHPNLRAFVSHGGMNSVAESTHAGIPIVCIPLFGDQMRNAKMIERRNVAYIIDKNNLTKHSLSHALNAVLFDPSYRNSAKRLARMIHKKPSSAKERLIKYVEFAAEFGPVENLDPASRKLNFFQYYLIDVILPVLAVILLILYAFLRLCLYLVRVVLRKKQKQE